MEENVNIIDLTDSYKVGHWKMYPEETETVYSYFESRPGAKFSETVFFGLQYIIKKYIEGKVVTAEKIKSAKELVDIHLGPNVFNEEGWNYILDTYDGYLPVRIMAVPEGTAIPTGNVLMTVQNLGGKKTKWLTNYLESILTHVWSSSTVASLSRETRKIINAAMMKTVGNTEGVEFMHHDFGFRGVSSVESAGICGLGHLIYSSGTDTVYAIRTGMNFYNSGVCAYSVNATEHSIMTSKGEEGEFEVFKNLLKKYPTGILSVVIDSYDWIRFISVYAKELKEEILARDGKLVFRPDSGDPIKTTIRVLELVAKVFGTTTKNGYKVLNPKVGVLWGDGIEMEGIYDILYAMNSFSWAASNIVFGQGGGLLQKINRDDQRFAFKCSAQLQNGVWVDIFKDPLDSSKKSKKGRLYLYKVEGAHGSAYYTTNIRDINQINQLKVVFEMGKLCTEYDFDKIRENAKL